jgi:hypothetical protein
MKQRRHKTRGPVVGGVVNQGRGDTTRQGRLRKAKADAAEMASVARKQLKLPTGREVMDVERTKEK